MMTIGWCIFFLLQNMLWIAWLIPWTVNIFSPIIILFSANYKPLTYPIFILFTPCSDIDYNHENLCVKWMKWQCLEWIAVRFIGLIYSGLLLSLSNDHFFSPFIISYFHSIQTPHVSQNTVFTPPAHWLTLEQFLWIWLHEPDTFWAKSISYF